MKAAFAAWDDRIAPVFDVARALHIVEAQSGRIVSESRETLLGPTPMHRVERLREIGVGILVCGAISNSLHASVTAHGIRVVPFVNGPLREVISAWLADRLEQGSFTMPGCRRARCRANFSREEDNMRSGGRRGMGRGLGGRSQGSGGGDVGRGAGMGSRSQGSGGRGRMGGAQAGGPGGYCTCPQCGHEEQHDRGAPCKDKRCPKCGAAMARK